MESTTGLTGSGANIILFTTGLGTPTGNPITPTIKISSNTELFKNMNDIIDINAGKIISGEKSIQQVGEHILQEVLLVASGKQTKAMTLKQDEFYSMEARCFLMSKLFDLSTKNAIVTGGGSGIGEAISKALAQNNAKVSIFDLDEQNAQRVVNEIEKTSGHATFLHCDVSNLKSVSEAFNRVTQESSIDILINNAGIAHIGNVSNTSPEDFTNIFNVNVAGVYHCLKIGMEHMNPNGSSIINVSSIAAHVGLSDRFAYSMSKGAVHAMTLSIAKDYLNQNVRCNSIAPARVHTPFVDGFLAKNYPRKRKRNV